MLNVILLSCTYGLSFRFDALVEAFGHVGVRGNPRHRGVLRSSINPNDLESPEERARRMEMVRQLQKTFYSEETGITKDTDGVFEDVPLWRVQWTELPGYQNVLNVHVPHYTHMFMKVLNSEKPWYFGHVYLPGGSENLDNPKYRLCEPDSEACHTGILMQVSDYKQLDDGRLVLIAQALGRFEIVEATQHVPYAVATVHLKPDEELIADHMEEARDMAAEREGMGVAEARAAARVGAVAEALYWESFEFRNVPVDECIGGGNGVSPLSNFDAGSLPTESFDAAAGMAKYLDGRQGQEMLSVSAFKTKASVDEVLEQEKETWISLDFMLQLLMACTEKANPNVPGESQVPIPTQLLGLLPTKAEWPEGFKLGAYAENMSKENSFVGTMNKSPFVLVNNAAPNYPPLRRAQRFSFAIWTLLEIVMVGYDPADQTRQSVLELESVTERLQAAKRGLDTINVQLRKTLGM